MNITSIIKRYTPQFLKQLAEKIENSPTGTRLARGFFWTMAGAAISRGLTFIANIVVARLLGKTGYGELGIINSTVSMFGIFAGFGLGVTATKYVAELRKKEPARAGRILGLSWIVAAMTGGFIALGLFLFAPWLATHTLNAPHLASVLKIAAFILLISALNGAQTGALSGFEAFKSIAYINFFIGLISFPILFFGAYWGGLQGVVWAMVVTAALGWQINHIAVRKEATKHQVPLTFKKCGAELPVLWKFSLPAVLSGAMVTPVVWLCNALLVNQPDGYGEMGIYNAANQWYNLLLLMPMMLGNVVLPVLSERLSQKDTKQTLHTIVLLIKVNALVVFPFILVFSIFSPYIMRLYGVDFMAGWPTLIVILLTAGLLSIQTPIGQFIAASGKMWLGFAMNLGWAFFFILGTILLINKGAFGLATARLISYVFHSIWTFGFVFWIVKKKTHLS